MLDYKDFPAGAMLLMEGRTLGVCRDVGTALRNLDRWIFLMQQVHEARYYIDRAQQLGHPENFQSLEGILEFLAHFRGALSSYAKCFVRAGPGKVTLNKHSVFDADSTMLALHDRIMELRHKYVAHSDSNEFESANIVEESSSEELVLRLQYRFCFPFDRLYELRDLVGVVERYVVDHHGNHVAAVEREIGKPVRIREGNRK